MKEKCEHKIEFYFPHRNLPIYRSVLMTKTVFFVCVFFHSKFNWTWTSEIHYKHQESELLFSSFFGSFWMRNKELVEKCTHFFFSWCLLFYQFESTLFIYHCLCDAMKSGILFSMTRCDDVHILFGVINESFHKYERHTHRVTHTCDEKRKRNASH